MRKLTFRDVFYKGSVKFNPVLVQCVALCPVIMATATLKNSLFASAVLFAEMLITCVFASLVMKKIPRYIRVMIYFIMGLAMVTPVLYYSDKISAFNLDSGMKIYLSLIAVNSITAVHCETFSVKNTVRVAFYDAIASGIGTAGVLIIVGAVREILGRGTVFDIPLKTGFALKGASMPFGCLIILGILAAILNLITGKKEIAEKEIKNEPEPAFSETAEEFAIEEITQPEEAYSDKQDENSEPAPTEVSMDFSDEDDEYMKLLSSVDELIEKFSDDAGGNKE